MESIFTYIYLLTENVNNLRRGFAVIFIYLCILKFSLYTFIYLYQKLLFKKIIKIFVDVLYLHFLIV